SHWFEMTMKVLTLGAVLLLAFLVLTVKSDNPTLFKGVFTLATIAITVCIGTVAMWPAFRGFGILKFPPLVWIGRISYGLYLWHWPVRGFVFGAASRPALGRIVAAIVLAFVIAGLSFYLIEQPFLKIKKR